jgi:AcrR family transcriptional regulator
MSRRRDQVQAMSQRIARAAYELHATVGPAHTTISAVAERAGVQRHTVYHHYPDLTSLFRACTEHGMRVTGIPEAGPWRGIEDPVLRLDLALPELYGYYRANAQLLGNVVRDMVLMTAVGGGESFTEHMNDLFAALATGWPGRDGVQRLRSIAIGHAMAFETWRSLTSPGLSDAEAANMMAGFVASVASPD